MTPQPKTIRSSRRDIPLLHTLLSEFHVDSKPRVPRMVADCTRMLHSLEHDTYSILIL